MDKEIVLLVLLGLIVASSTPLRASEPLPIFGLVHNDECSKKHSSLYLDLIDLANHFNFQKHVFHHQHQDDSPPALAVGSNVCQILYSELYRRAFSLQ